MYRRPSVYYPESAITTNLYTNGKEWMLENGTEYTGFYHKYIDGLVLTEPYYSKIRSELLIPYKDPSLLSVNIYNKLKNVEPYPAVSPVNYYSIPTLEDYSKGFFKRYFIFRKNYTDILRDIYEVNEDQYKSWKTPKQGINEVLYDAFIIEWKLTGPLHDVRKDERIQEEGVHSANYRSVHKFDRVFPGTSSILTDFTEFSIYSPITSYDIKKQFGNFQ